MPGVRTALLFAYRGSAFDGYARQPQPGLRTVEGALLEGLVRRSAVASPEDARLRSGSRTDRGVSALANVLCFDAAIPAERVPAALGATVEGLWPLAALPSPEGFDPRKARRREYRYWLPFDRLPQGAGAPELEEALSPFVGTHDFSAFARLEEGRDPLRTVESIAVDAVPGAFEVRVVGNSFLWRQVRRMLAAGVAVCRAEASRAELVRALDDPASARDLGQVPPEGLVLWDVQYEGLRFAARAPEAVLSGLLWAAWQATAEAAWLTEMQRRWG